MHDLFMNLRLDDVQRFLASGNPPIFVQLLIIIGLWLFIFLYQRLRTRTVIARHAGRAIRWLLIGACFAVLGEEEWLPFVLRSLARITQHIHATMWRF